MQLRILNTSLQADEVVVRPERHPQRLVDEELLDVLVDGQPLAVVLCGSRVVDELVELGIAVVAERQSSANVRGVEPQENNVRTGVGVALESSLLLASLLLGQQCAELECL